MRSAGAAATSASSNAQRMARGALLLVQIAPCRSPQKALIAAVEFM